MIGEPTSGIDKEACLWVARIDRGLSGDERSLLSEWLSADPRRQGALLRAQAAFSLLDRGRALGAANEDEAPASPLKSRRQLLRLGGSMAAMLATGLAWRLWPIGEQLATRVGEVRRLPLEDGSIAVVNTGSRLRVAFTRERRDVELASGEAWFQVAKNHARPFTVATGPARVQAVGTAFDVRRHDGATEVVVTEGTVKVWSVSADAGPAFVKAGQRAMISDRHGLTISAVTVALSDQQLAWREGRIVLDDMTLASAAAEFNRYHDVQLQIDPVLADKRLVGWFNTDDLDGFVNASATVVGGHVERTGGVIRIVQ